MINANPTAIKTPRLLSDVTALNNSMAPANPRINVAIPCTGISKGAPCVISGKKIPESNAKIASK